jgi:hypothetical protein
MHIQGECRPTRAIEGCSMFYKERVPSMTQLVKHAAPQQFTFSWRNHNLYEKNIEKNIEKNLRDCDCPIVI